MSSNSEWFWLMHVAGAFDEEAWSRQGGQRLQSKNHSNGVAEPIASRCAQQGRGPVDRGLARLGDPGTGDAAAGAVRSLS